MTFKGKTLVATGCSHTYGSFLIDNEETTCHARSWVKKLERIGEFDHSVNLATGGGSNGRAFRVIKEYILANLNCLHDKVIMFGITEPARFELPSPVNFNLDRDLTFKSNYFMNKFGPWQINNNDQLGKFLPFAETYFGCFTVDRHLRHTLFLDMFAMHILLKHFNIEHYFFAFRVYREYFKGYPIDMLPLFFFNNGDAVDFAKSKGFKVGKNIIPSVDCNHLDHDGNQFIAECIYEMIKPK